MGQTDVKSERLVLFKKLNTVGPVNDTGILRFCPYVAYNWNHTPTYPIEVFENGQRLDVGIGYSLYLDGGITSVSYHDLSVFSNYTLNPPKVWVKINSPKLNALYTVDYVIRTSDSKEVGEATSQTVWLDIDKTVSLHADGRVIFRQENPDTIVTSKIYLQVTLRRNVASQAASPELIEYAILASSY
jgi:hypothetical protein